MMDTCIKCTEDLIQDDPWYDAKDYTEELSSENIVHAPEDTVCTNCASHYEVMRAVKRQEFHALPKLRKASIQSDDPGEYAEAWENREQ